MLYKCLANVYEWEHSSYTLPIIIVAPLRYHHSDVRISLAAMAAISAISASNAGQTSVPAHTGL